MPSSAPPRRRGIALATAATLLATSACTVANSEAGDAGAGGDTLRIVLAQEPPTLEPCESSLTGTGMVVRSNITEPLIERDPTTGDLLPLLSTGWRQTTPTSWTFDLRGDVTFSDGRPFTAEDAAFTIDRAVNSDLMCNVDGYVFDSSPLGLHVDSPTRLTVTTEKPDPILPLRLSFVEMVPRTTDTDAKVREPVGTGPYAIADWQTGVSITLRRNDIYWGDAPAYPRVRYVWRSESSVRAAMIAKGEVDMAAAIDPVDATPENSIAYPNNETTALRLDGTQAPLDDIRVRKAVGLAIDRQAIVDILFNGDAIPAAQLIPQGVVGYNDTLQPVRQDLDAARKLVRAAKDDGVPVDREITLVGRNNQFPRVAETVEAIQYQLTQIGLTVKILMLDTAAQLSYQLRPFPENAGPVAALIMHGNQAGDAGFTTSQYLRSDGPQSYFGDQTLDDKITAADQLAGDARQQAFADIFAYQNDDVVQFAYIAHMQGLMGISPGVHYEPNPATGDELRLAEISPAEGDRR